MNQYVSGSKKLTVQGHIQLGLKHIEHRFPKLYGHEILRKTIVMSGTP